MDGGSSDKSIMIFLIEVRTAIICALPCTIGAFHQKHEVKFAMHLQSMS